MRKCLVSTGTLPMCVGKQFFEYMGIFEALEFLDVDGIELVFLPEWDKTQPPLTPTSANWAETPKITPKELVELVLSKGIHAPTVHINRDVGNMLGNLNDKETVLRGQRILEDNLAGASKLRSEIAVFHLWDTRSANLDLQEIFSKAYEVSKDFKINLAIENVPISDPKLDVKAAWSLLTDLMPSNYGFTLDLNWCSFYDNFQALLDYQDRVLNVHVQGFLSKTNRERPTIVPRVGELDVEASLRTLLQRGYTGYLTLEMNKATGKDDFIKALKIISAFSGKYGRGA